MNTVQLLFVSVSLSMDAVAVSLCKGLSMKRCSFSRAFPIAFSFGFFQALMPLFGFDPGSSRKLRGTGRPLDRICLVGLPRWNHPYRSYAEKECHSPKSPSKVKFAPIDCNKHRCVRGRDHVRHPKDQPRSAMSMIGVITFTLCLLALYLGKHGNTLLSMQSGSAACS